MVSGAEGSTPGARTPKPAVARGPDASLGAARALRVALIGHLNPNRPSITPSKTEAWAYRYTRVLQPDGSMLDHLAWLARSRGLPPEERYSVWQMLLCAGLELRTLLERQGHEVLLVNSIEADDEAESFGRIRAFAPDLVALGTTFLVSPSQLGQVMRTLRRYLPDAFVVAGGHHVYTALLHLEEAQQRRYLEASRIDVMINDVQGEATLVRLLQAFPDDLARVPNLLWNRRAGESVVTRRQVESNPIDNADVDLKGIPEGSVVHLRTSRGCPYHCGFCSYPTVAGAWTQMEVERVILKLRQARAANVGAVIFVDDTFNVSPQRFSRLLDRMIQEGLRIPWYSFARSQHLDGPLARKMKASGCQGVLLGLESGADEILERIGKGTTVDRMQAGLRCLTGEGILTVGSFILGYPGETARTVDQTKSFLRVAGLDFYYPQLFYYLPHTPVHRDAARYQLTGSGLTWSHSTMTWREASAAMDALFLEVEGPVCVHQDYNLWEVAYLLSRGLAPSDVLAYRRTVNGLLASRLRSGECAASTV